jgi:hypothetical protein
MGGTGLEPVTPSLSTRSDVRLGSLAFAQSAWFSEISKRANAERCHCCHATPDLSADARAPKCLAPRLCNTAFGSWVSRSAASPLRSTKGFLCLSGRLESADLEPLRSGAPLGERDRSARRPICVSSRWLKEAVHPPALHPIGGAASAARGAVVCARAADLPRCDADGVVVAGVGPIDADAQREQGRAERASGVPPVAARGEHMRWIATRFASVTTSCRRVAT